MATDRRPDGGWGWAIAFSAFLFNFLADGMKYSFGIMFMELIETFHKSKGETSWILSIQLALLYASSPVAAGLVNRFGCRPVAATGAIIVFSGFLASSFATSVFFLYLTYGVLGGLGYGLCMLPLSVSIARYFDKRLALASGVGAMGSGVGMLLFGPLSKVLIDKYTWKGTLLIQAALVMNGLPCAAVLKPVKTIRKKLGLHFEENTRSRNGKTPMEIEVRATESDKLNGCLEETNVNGWTTNGDIYESANSNESSFELENYNKIPPIYKPRLSFAESNGSWCLVPERENQLNYSKTISDKDETVKRWLSLTPLTEVRYLLLLGSLVLVELSLMVPFTFLPDMMSQNGYTRNDSAFILFLIGLLSTAARIVVGFLADLRFIDRVKFCYSIIILNGVMVVLCPFCFNYATHVAFAVLFGFLSGSSAVLRAVMVPELFGVEMVADRMSIIHFFCGFSALVGLPITGAIYDASGSYLLPFIVAGVELLVSGLLVLVITLMRKPAR